MVEIEKKKKKAQMSFSEGGIECLFLTVLIHTSPGGHTQR